MVQYKLGQAKEASTTLAAAMRSTDWKAMKPDNREAWMCIILRREAEALILPNLSIIPPKK